MQCFIKFDMASNAEPNFAEMIGFSVFSSLLNVPVVSLFRMLYQRVGASAVTQLRYDLLAKTRLTSMKDIEKDRESVTSLSEGEHHLYLIEAKIRAAKASLLSSEDAGR